MKKYPYTLEGCMQWIKECPELFAYAIVKLGVAEYKALTAADRCAVAMQVFKAYLDAVDVAVGKLAETDTTNDEEQQ